MFFPLWCFVNYMDLWKWNFLVFMYMQVGNRYWPLPGFTHTMKSGFKNGWPSVVRLHLREKSVTPFCIFSKVKPAGNMPGNTPVYLNVYDLTTVNGYMYWAGIGIFHSGVEGQLTVKTFSNLQNSFSSFYTKICA